MYRIDYFDDVILPSALPEDDLSTQVVDSGMVKTVNGSYDSYGSQTVDIGRKTIVHRGLYTVPSQWVDHDSNCMVDNLGNLLVFDYDTDAIRGRLAPLQEKIGQLLPLWRTLEYTGDRQYTMARLMNIQATRTVKEASQVLMVTSTFEVANPKWIGVAATATASISGSGTKALETINDGLNLNDAVLTITASATISTISIIGMGTNITITQALTSGQVLTIDCSAPSVKVGTTNAYSGFVINSTHTINDWIRVANGYNLWYVTSDNSCTISLGYNVKWA